MDQTHAPVRLEGRPKVFRDPVHGDITYGNGGFQELAILIINSEPFQRLRRIRQNGVANLVFHGAEHSRFAHSMGVAWIARQMVEAAARNSAITLDTEEHEAVVLAALLHDVGHGPFSHLIEEVINKRDEGLQTPRFHHERMTVRLISEETSPLARLLNCFRAGLSEQLVPFIDRSPLKQHKWHYTIVSSQLDADRLDYLARDGYMAGVQTHQFDFRRLISFLGVVDNQLVVDIRARDVLENYLLALDQMYQSVYYHHTVRAASSIVKMMLQRAVDYAKTGSRQRAKTLPDSGKSPNPLWTLVEYRDQIPIQEYMKLDDSYMWVWFQEWRDADDNVLKDLADRLSQRRLPKAIDLPDLPLQSIHDLYDEVCLLWDRQNSGLPAKYYIEFDDPSRVGYKRYKSGDGPFHSIMVRDREGEVHPIEELPRTVVSVIEKRYVAARIIVPPEIANGVRELIKQVSII